MNRSLNFCAMPVVCLSLFLAFSANSANGEVIYTGDVAPNPAVAGSDLRVGNYGTGALSILNGSNVSNKGGWVGVFGGSIGTIIVDGNGSTWTNTYTVGIALSGEGTLDIRNGGDVSTDENGIIAGSSGSIGTVTVNGIGSTWSTAKTLSMGNGRGTLNIQNAATVSCGVLSAGSNEPGVPATITVNGAWSKLDVTSNTFIGKSGACTLNIQNGGSVTNSVSNSWIGYWADGSGKVTIEGNNSTWTNSGDLSVGEFGMGELNVQNGGNVSSRRGYIGHYANSEGTVTVDGSGSTWNNANDYVYVGTYGKGTLHVRNGGSAYRGWGYGMYIGLYSGSEGTASVEGEGSNLTINGLGSLYIGGGKTGAGGTGLLNVDNGGEAKAYIITNWETGNIVLGVSGDNMLIANSDFVNHGVVRLSAGAGLSAGTYTPISVGGDWLGSGGYEAFGGLWDETLHTFTVAAAQSSDSGVETTVDMSDAPRLDITDGATGQQVGASFAEGTGTIDFTATTMTDPTGLADLSIMLTSGETILSGWDFNTDLPAGEEVLLSFYVGDGYDTEGLEIWHYDDMNNWIAYDATDLAYANGWVSFTVDGFSGYAVTNVPEPATLSLLALGGLTLVLRRRIA